MTFYCYGVSAVLVILVITLFCLLLYKLCEKDRIRVAKIRGKDPQLSGLRMDILLLWVLLMLRVIRYIITDIHF